MRFWGRKAPTDRDEKFATLRATLVDGDAILSALQAEMTARRRRDQAVLEASLPWAILAAHLTTGPLVAIEPHIIEARDVAPAVE